MKKMILLLIAIVLTLSIFIAASASLPVGTEMCAEDNESSLQTAAMSAQGKVSSMKIALGKDQGVAAVDVQRSDSTGTIIDIDVKSIQEEEITVNNEVFQILTISGYDYTYEVGKPQMPVIRETIGIPDGASVQATILDASYSTYKGYNVYPVQPPEVDLENNSEFVIDEVFYSQDVFYPQELVEVGVPGIWRDLSVVGLQVNPVLFNPATGELRVYDHIKLELEYYDGVTEKKTIEPKFARMYETIILNYDYLDLVVEEGTIPPRDNAGLEDEPGDQVTVSKDEGAVDVYVLRSDSRGTIISISDVEVEEEEITVNGEMFQILTIPGYDYTYEVGKPQMPVIRETIGIPDGASVQATILDASYSTYKGYNVYPVQPPEVDRVEGTEFVIDEEFYSQGVFYPEELVELGTPSIWRDLNVVSLQVNPVMFNPATGELRIYDHIKLELEYYDGVTETKTIEPKFAEMYRNVILNFDSLDIVLAGGKGTSSIQEAVRLDAPADQIVKYLEIRHDDHSTYATIKPLLDYHESQGLPYEAWYFVSGSSPTDQDIKDLIVDRYTEHPELEYVLLVGDISFLPWNASWDGVPSDYWFGCVAGSDLYADLAVGRLSANSDTEITQQVNKILTYLQSPPSGNWINKVLLVAHKELAPGKYQGCKEDIRTATYSNPFTFDTAYGASAANGGDDATNADVTSAINAGRGIVNYRGHGAFDSPAPRPWGTFWGGQYLDLDPAPWNTAGELYTTTEAHALANGDKTPVVFSISCMNNALDNPSNECLGEAFVKDDDSAVAFLGASRSSYTVPNHIFDKSLFNATGNLNIDNIGWVSNYANTVLINKYGQTHTFMKNVKIYLWLGDPALEFASIDEITYLKKGQYGAEDYDLYIYSAPTTIGQHGAYTASDYWSPDGNTVAVTAIDIDGDDVDEIAYLKKGAYGAEDYDLWIYTAPTTIGQHGTLIASDYWSPDGNTVGITAIDIDGDGVDEIAYLKKGAYGATDYDLYIYTAPTTIGQHGTLIASDYWAPDGSTVGITAIGMDKIAYLKKGAYGDTDYDLYIYTAPTTIGQHGTLIASDYWAPDGNTVGIAAIGGGDEIAYLKKGAYGTKDYDLYVYTAPTTIGEHGTLIASDYWSPDGQTEGISALE